MKTMKLQKQLNRFFFYLFFTVVSTNLFAETAWEVATIFFGAQEDQSYFNDVQKNITELKKIKPSPYLKISVLREGLQQNLTFNEIELFLKKSFSQKHSKKMLVLYGHGEGPSGLKSISATDLESVLRKVQIKYDILWFDACFMANLEFLFHMRSQSSYTIASEEAEFSSGLPFGTLSELPLQKTVEQSALFLAKSFIDSYSFTKIGSQTSSISTSSATISVVKNSEIQEFITLFKKIPLIIRSLSVESQENLKTRVQSKYHMDNPNLVDLGNLLIELRATNKSVQHDRTLTELIRLLNISSVKKLKTNIRFKIENLSPTSRLVFGFNNWDNGSKDEYLDNSLFSDILKTDQFILGANKEYWPVFHFKGKSTYLTPFAPGINSFHYYFVDGPINEVISKMTSISRNNDVIETATTMNELKGQFLIYSAYTQRIGSKAERYTGINISLFNEAPSMDYFESEFNQFVKWLHL